MRRRPGGPTGRAATTRAAADPGLCSDNDIRAGLLLVVACPIGGMSNLYTYLARASTALSVTLTACSSVLAVLTIPLLDVIFGAASGHRMGLTAPLPLIVGQLLLMLLFPSRSGCGRVSSVAWRVRCRKPRHSWSRHFSVASLVG